MATPPLYIVGAGAVGLHLAARLSAVTPVTVVARGPRVGRLLRDGFELSGAEQGHFKLPVVDIAEPLPASADLLLAVKATQLADTLAQLAPGPQHTLGLCQNGLGIAALARMHAPAPAHVRVACWLGAGLASPTNVRVSGVFQLELPADYFHPDRERQARSSALWFGPAGTVTALHHDTSNILLCQVVGRKRLRIFPPDEPRLLAAARGVYNDLDPERDADALAARGHDLVLAPVVPQT